MLLLPSWQQLAAATCSCTMPCKCIIVLALQTATKVHAFNALLALMWVSAGLNGKPCCASWARQVEVTHAGIQAPPLVF